MASFAIVFSMAQALSRPIDRAKTYQATVLARRALKTAFLLLFTAGISAARPSADAMLDQAAAAYRAGDMAKAEQSLKTILEKKPDELGALLLIGIVLDSEKRYTEAEGFHERALHIAPGSAQVLNNIANHYLATGDADKARQFYEKALVVDVHHTNANLQLAQISINNKQGPLALSYLNRLNHESSSDSRTIVLRTRALAMCGRCTEAREAANALANDAAGAEALFSLGIAFAECRFYRDAERSFSRARDIYPKSFDILYNLGLASLRSGDIERAQAAFEDALKIRPRDIDTLRELAQTRVQLAFVFFHREGPNAALRELDKTPEIDRTGDNYLLRAQVLDAQGKVTEAAAALNQALRAAPGNVSLYHEAIDFLLKHKLYHEAETFLEEAVRIRPDDRDLLLAQALTLNLLRRDTDSEDLLEKIETKWPEWDRVYLLKGMLLEIALKSDEAMQTLAKAIALGAHTSEAYYYEALAITHAAPQDLDAAQNAISRALALNSEDPYICLLAGKISASRKDYPTAVKHLLRATRIEPSLVPAHYALRHAYEAMGDKQKAEVEMQAIQRIAQRTHGTDESRFAVEDFLFAVRPPG